MYNNVSLETIKEVAAEARRSFVMLSRDGKDFTAHAENAPEWLKDITYGAHAGIMPDDWTYECVADACERIEDAAEAGNDVEDAGNDFEPDIYNNALVAWMASGNARWVDVSEALEEFGSHDVIQGIQMAQVNEYRRIFSIVLEGIQERAQEVEDEREEQSE